MKLGYFRGYLIAFVTFALAAPAVAIDLVERTAARLFDLIAPVFKDTRDFRVAYDGPVAAIDRPSLASSLLQSLRHEAGTRLRAAGRGG